MPKIATIVREYLGLNAYQMAKRMKLSVTAWQRFERAKRMVSQRNLIRLWQVSELDGEEFMRRWRDSL